MAREWYRFFFNLFNLTGGGTTDTSLADLQIGPPVYDVTGAIDQNLDSVRLSLQSDTVQDALFEIEKQVEALEANSQQEQFSELLKRIEGLEQSPSKDDLLEIIKRLEALESAPLPQTHLKRAAYGTFYDTTTQTAAAINTAYGMTFNTTDLSIGVYVGSPTSRIYVDRTSIYNIQFSAQLDNTSGGDHSVYIWLSINGTNVANSASQIQVRGNNGYTLAAWNFVQLLKEGDYFELKWSVSDTSVRILAQAASAPVPAIPSILLTVTDNIIG
tara:strand:- start:964 stop:1779 length:816 start_codon:yes stop_codon:yes gene_type:complete